MKGSNYTHFRPGARLVGTGRRLAAAVLCVVLFPGCGAKTAVDRTQYIEHKAVQTRMIMDGQSDEAFYRKTGLSREEWTAMENRHRFDHDAVVAAGEKVRAARGRLDRQEILSPSPVLTAIAPLKPAAARSSRRARARAR